jgi:ankyrin repeat protein
VKLVQRLVKAGGHPQIADNNGFTPLMASISHNYLKLVKYLITRPEVAQCVNITDRRGLSALNYAYETHHYECLRVLLRLNGLDPTTLSHILKSLQYRNEKTQSIIDLVLVIKKYLNIQQPTSVDHTPITFKPQPTRQPRMMTPREEIPSTCEVTDDLFQLVYGSRDTNECNIIPFDDNEIRDMTSRPTKTPTPQDESIIYKEITT